MTDITLKDLLEAGSHFGHQARRWNPAMKKYVYGERDGVHIFDLAKTKAGLDSACEYVKSVVKDGGKILYVGTKQQASALVKSEAIRAGMPYMAQRWMGGMLTNFKQLSGRVRRMQDLKTKKAAGELKIYTKREQLLLDREVESLEKFFGGVVEMDKIPQAMFVVDTHKEDVAVREAVRVGTKVVGMVDTNGNPELVDYVIPGNDDALKAIELVVTRITDAIIEARKAVAEKPVESKAKPKKVGKIKKDEKP